VRSVDYCTGLFVWGLEVCAHLVVGGVCVAEVRGGGLRYRIRCGPDEERILDVVPREDGARNSG